MLKKCLLLMVFLFSAVVYGDVAMVTDLTGTVEASLENSSWSVSLAEILSDGTHVKTGKESSLKIIHMAGNKEYQLGAEKEAVITASGISGENILEKELQIVANSFDLGSDSSNQAGAAHVDRGPSVSDSEKADEEEAAAPSPEVSRKSMSDQSAGVYSGKSQDSKKAENVIARENFDETVTQLGGSNIEEPELLKNQISFALPVPVLEKFAASGQILDIDNSEVKNFSNSEIVAGWVLVDVEVATSAAEISLNLKGEKEILIVKVFSGQKISSEISLAWKLEREGYLAQAAWIWISLKDQGRLASEKADVHLKRISDRMLK